MSRRKSDKCYMPIILDRCTTVSREVVTKFAEAFGFGDAPQVKEWQFFSLARLALANPSYSVSILDVEYPIITEEYSLFDGQVRTIHAGTPDEMVYTPTTGGWLPITDDPIQPDELELNVVIERIASARTKQLVRVDDDTVLVLNARFNQPQRGKYTAIEIRFNKSVLTVISVKPNARAKTDVVVSLIPNVRFTASVIEAPSARTSVWSKRSRRTCTGLVAMQLEKGAVIKLPLESNAAKVEWENGRFVKR